MIIYIIRPRAAI